jgi:hypothetical protein
MKLYYTFLLRIASIKFLIFWLAVYAAALAFFMVPLQGLIINGSESGLIDLMPFFSKVDFYQALSDYGDAGRSAYLEFWYYDFLYPFVYMILMYTLMGLSFRRIDLLQDKGTYWMYIPLIAVLIDFAENLSFLTIINAYPEQNLAFFWLAFLFSSLKWLAVFAIVLRIVATLFKKKAR